MKLINHIDKPMMHILQQDALLTAGININLHYIPIYRHPYDGRMSFNTEQYQEAESYYCEAISIPLYLGLTTAQQDQIVAEIGMTLSR